MGDFTTGGLEAHPLLYGLIAFARMLGPHARLVPVQLHTSGRLRLKLWAVRVGPEGGSPDRLNLLVINKSRRSAAIKLHLPARGPALVQRLLAPSAASTSGVTLAGQQLGPQVEWQGNMHLTVIRRGASGYALQVRGQSAALLTVAVGPGTLAAPPQQSHGPRPLFGFE